MGARIGFRLLGPLEVVGGGAVVTIGANKQRVILSALLLRANRVVPLDDLVDRLWAQPPPGARATAQAHAQRLRRTLGEPDGRRLIRTVPGGYLLEAVDDEVDLLRFEALLDRARAAATRGDVPGESALLRDAARLWRGRPMVNVVSDVLHSTDVPALEEARLRMVERRLELELVQGDPADAVAELARLTRQEPYRERLWMLRMRALYQQGRQGEALACYREAAGRLRGELGLDPGPELAALRDAILRHAPELGGRRMAAAAPVLAVPGRERGPLPQARCQLPRATDDFVGRAAQWQQIVDCLGRPALGAPVVAVTGPPGIGTTALAVVAAHRLRPRYPDGQLYLRVDGAQPAHRATARVLADLLRMLGLDLRALPDSVEHRASLLRGCLADRRVLLVLDGVREVGQARLLLPATGRSGVLIASGYRLTGLPGATTVRLGPLAPEESSALLTRLVGARARREPAAVAEVAAECGHVPLALRAAAVRLALRPGRPVAWLAGLLSGGPGRRTEPRDGYGPLAELRVRGFDVPGALERRYAALSVAARRMLDVWATAGDPGPTDSRALEELVEAHLADLETVDGFPSLPVLVRRYAAAKAADAHRADPQPRWEAAV
jgi:DNA-binding SARP family transcriptional activator